VKNYRYLIMALVVGAAAVAAVAACERGMPVEPIEEQPAVEGIVPTADVAGVDATEQLYACYSGGGNVYRIRERGLPVDCRAPGDVEFSWNEQGPPGPQGDPGLSGIQRVSNPGTVPGNTALYNVNVTCPTGKVVLGGGFGGIPSNIRLIASWPVGNPPNQWWLAVENTTSTPTQITAWAICAYAGS
jgi:hypothetical protein